MSKEILFTSVNHPPEIEFYMNRPRINELLKKLMNKPLLVISASAGFGKTQALAYFLKSTKEYERFSWFTLNELDNVLSRYAQRFIYASNKKLTNLGSLFEKLVYPYTEETFVQYNNILLELSSKYYIIQVLDDYHNIKNPQMLDFLERHVLMNIPNHIIIVLTREKIAINLSKIVDNKLVNFVTQSDLLFTIDEMEEYFNKLDIYLLEDRLKLFYKITQGWIFAIEHLAELVKSYNVNNEDIAQILTNKIYDFVETDVFSHFSSSLQLLCLKLSMLPVIATNLIDLIVENDTSLLEELKDINFFIKYNETQHIYELNLLFKCFLVEKQNRENIVNKFDLYSMVGDWYNSNGFYLEAIKCFELSKEYDKLLVLILKYKDFCSLETAFYFVNIIENIPQKYKDDNKLIIVVYARYLMHVFELVKASELIRTLIEELEASDFSEKTNLVLGEAYIMMAWVSMLTRTHDFVDLFKKALKCLPNGSALIDNRLQIIPGNNITFAKTASAKTLQTFEEAYFKAMPNGVKVMNGCAAGLDYLVAAETGYFMRDFRKAEKNAYECAKRAKEQGQYGIENTAKYVLLRISVSRGDYIKCSSILHDYKNNINGLETNLAQFDIVEGWFYNTLGETDKIASWIINDSKLAKNSLPILLNEKNILRARIFLTDNKYYELLAFLEQLIIIYSDKDLLLVNIHLPIIKALALYYIGDKENACKCFEHAYNLSKKIGITMPFIEYGTKMRTFLLSYKQFEEKTIPADWVDAIYSKSSTYAKSISTILKNYGRNINSNTKTSIQLTKRELEVLKHLCQGLTREQIAASCDLSINTVKKVLQNVYVKLGATNKNDAIYIATTNNLLI